MGRQLKHLFAAGGDSIFIHCLQLSEQLTTLFAENADLSRLRYALLPSLPGLDEPEGGKAVVRLAELCDADLVIIDTFGRAVHGDENDADTVRSWYRWTGIHLKHAGRAFLRVDHAGKDVTKGQRGTSAKNDDVDVVWQMAAKEAGTFTLTAKKRRMGWVPLTVDIVMNEDGHMRFDLLHGHAWPAGTAEVAKVLDGLGIDPTASSREVARAYRESGNKARSDALRAAQKYRQDRSVSMHFASDQPVDNVPESVPHESGHTPAEDDRGTPRGTPAAKTVKPLVDGSGHTSGHTGAHLADVDGAQRATYKGARVPNVPDDPPQLEITDPLTVALAEGF